MIHRRNATLERLKKLDAFPKVAESYVKQSVIGGTFSVICFCLIIYLIYGETRYFLNGKLQFKFEPFTDIDEKLKINLDMTVAMPCHLLGADFVDTTNENMNYESLQKEDTWWEMLPDQRVSFDTLKYLNSYFSEEYHAIHELLWRSKTGTFISGDNEKREMKRDYPPDACRIHGSVHVNKVIGNLHIVTGKLLEVSRSHIHLALFITEKDFNFTHRINKFSFGDSAPGIIYPLEGDEKIANYNMMTYMYFIDVVQTDINLLFHKSKAYQYSVKHYERTISENNNHYGIPGIYFQYDISSLKVNVTQQRDSVIQFLVKLCATVGGIYVTNGLINMIFQAIMDVVKDKYFHKKQEEYKTANISTHSMDSKASSMILFDVSPNVDVNVFTK